MFQIKIWNICIGLSLLCFQMKIDKLLHGELIPFDVPMFVDLPGHKRL